MVISALIKSSANPIQSSDIITNIHDTRGNTGSQTPTKMTEMNEILQQSKEKSWLMFWSIPHFPASVLFWDRQSLGS